MQRNDTSRGPQQFKAACAAAQVGGSGLGFGDQAAVPQTSAQAAELSTAGVHSGLSDALKSLAGAKTSAQVVRGCLTAT